MLLGLKERTMRFREQFRARADEDEGDARSPCEAKFTSRKFKEEEKQESWRRGREVRRGIRELQE